MQTVTAEQRESQESHVPIGERSSNPHTNKRGSHTVIAQLGRSWLSKGRVKYPMAKQEKDKTITVYPYEIPTSHGPARRETI